MFASGFDRGSVISVENGSAPGESSPDRLQLRIAGSYILAVSGLLPFFPMTSVMGRGLSGSPAGAIEERLHRVVPERPEVLAARGCTGRTVRSAASRSPTTPTNGTRRSAASPT